jgi:hypothetical protein
MTDAADLGNARVVVIRVCDRADPIPAELSTFRGSRSLEMNTIGLAMAAAYLLAVTKRNFVHVMCGFAWRPELFEIEPDVSLCLAENPFFTERQHETC